MAADMNSNAVPALRHPLAARNICNGTIDGSRSSIYIDGTSIDAGNFSAILHHKLLIIFISIALHPDGTGNTGTIVIGLVVASLRSRTFGALYGLSIVIMLIVNDFGSALHRQHAVADDTHSRHAAEVFQRNLIFQNNLSLSTVTISGNHGILHHIGISDFNGLRHLLFLGAFPLPSAADKVTLP